MEGLAAMLWSVPQCPGSLFKLESPGAQAARGSPGRGPSDLYAEEHSLA